MDPSKSFKTRRFRRELDTGERVAAASSRRVLDKHLLETRVEVGIPAGYERYSAGTDGGTLEIGGGAGLVGAVPMTRDIAREPLRDAEAPKTRTDTLRAKGNTKTHRGQPRPGAAMLSPDVTGEYTKVNEDPQLPLARPLMTRAPVREQADPRMSVGERPARQYTTSEFAGLKASLGVKRAVVEIVRPAAAAAAPPVARPTPAPAVAAPAPAPENVAPATITAAPAPAARPTSEQAVAAAFAEHVAPDASLAPRPDGPDAPLDAIAPSLGDESVSARSLMLFVLALMAATTIIVLIGL